MRTSLSYFIIANVAIASIDATGSDFIQCIPGTQLQITSTLSGATNTPFDKHELAQRFVSVLRTGLSQNWITLGRLDVFADSLGSKRFEYEVDHLYLEAPALLKRPQIQALKLIYDQIEDKNALAVEIRNLIKRRNLDLQVKKTIKAKSVSRFTPLNFSPVNPIPFPLNLVAMGEEIEHHYTLLYNDQRAKHGFTLDHGLLVSQTPITWAMWRETMGNTPELPSPHFDRYNAPIIGVSEPSIYFYLNRLSALHGLNPAYNKKFLMKSTAVRDVAAGVKLTYEQLEAFAAQGKVQWINEIISTKAKYEMVMDSSKTEGYRLPTGLELLMIFEKIRTSLLELFPPTEDPFLVHNGVVHDNYYGSKWATKLANHLGVPWRNIMVRGNPNFHKMNIERDVSELIGIDIDPETRIVNLLDSVPLMFTENQITVGIRALDSVERQMKTLGKRGNPVPIEILGLHQVKIRSRGSSPPAINLREEWSPENLLSEHPPWKLYERVWRHSYGFIVVRSVND